MRRRWLIPAAGAILCTAAFGGCCRQSSMTAEDTASLLAENYTADVNIVLAELEVRADLTREDGQTAVVITSPEHLEGLSFDGNTVRYKDLRAEAASLPAASLGTVLDGAFDLLEHAEMFTAAENGDMLCVRCEGKGIALFLKDRVPVSMVLSDPELTVEFCAFVPSEPDA